MTQGAGHKAQNVGWRAKDVGPQDGRTSDESLTKVGRRGDNGGDGGIATRNATMACCCAVTYTINVTSFAIPSFQFALVH